MADALFGGDYDQPDDKQAGITIRPSANAVAPPISGPDSLFGGDYPIEPEPPPAERYQLWPERLARGIAQAAGQSMILPGQVAQGKFAVQPTVPGQWSDMDEARQQLADDALLKRSTQAAGFIGTGGIPSVTREGLSSIPLLNSGIAPETAKIAQTAMEKYGFPVRPGQMSENWMVRSLDSLLQKLPFSGYGKNAAEQQNAINSGLAKIIGVDAEKITPEVMSQAKEKLGNTYKQIYSPEVKAPLDEKFSAGILDTLDRAGQVLDNPAQVKVLNKAVSNILDKVKEDGTIAGPAYQGLRQTGSVLKDLEKSPGLLGQYAGEIKGHLDDLFRRTIPPDKSNLLQKTDQQYAIMKQLRPLVSEVGDISPARLMQLARSGEAGKERMAFGRGGDLGELANIGQRFKTMPSSNTAENSTLMKILYGALGGGGVTAGMGAYMHDPLMAAGPLVTGATGAATTRLLGQYMKSPTRAQRLIDQALKTGPQAPGVMRSIVNKGADVGIAPYLPAIGGPSQ